MNLFFPFVSRAAFEQAVARAVAAERLVEVVRLDANKQIAHAFEQSSKSIDQARAAMIDARAAMRDAIEISKTAAKVMFGGVTEGTVPESTSVSANDALTARRRREEAERPRA